MMNELTRILAIETSCDETAAAIVESGTEIMSNIIASQTELHAEFGGVFPELASRKHIEVIYAVVDRALKEAHLGVEDLDCVAVTYGPGLVGSLLVGVNVAKGLAAARHKPLLGINHIEGHIYSLWLTDMKADITFPVVTLVASGGHTELYLVEDHLQFKHLGGTLDDAAGEAFDKVGRLLGLPYPGGPAIDKISERGNSAAFNFPRAIKDDNFNFSFSGLKTAVLRQTKRFEEGRMPTADIAASFQAAVVDSLVSKTQLAANYYEAKAIHVAGGVSANSLLRQKMQEGIDIPIRFPPPILCTDNAAMIAAAAHWRFISGQSHGLDLDVIPNLQL